MRPSKVHPVRSVVPAAKVSKSTKAPAKRPARKPASLPKFDGNAGVQAYIASMEPWQAAIAKRVDALVVKHVPASARP